MSLKPPAGSTASVYSPNVRVLDTNPGEVATQIQDALDDQTVFVLANEVHTVSTGIIVRAGQTLGGRGVGGDVFSATDADLPWSGAVLRAASSLDGPVIKSDGFADFTGVASPADADAVPQRFCIRDLVIDGNAANQSSGIPVQLYGRSFRLSNVVIQNGKDGGIWTEGPSGGYDMEAKVSDVWVTSCAGVGWDHRGPHDSQWSNVTVGFAAAGATIGIRIKGQVGGEQFTNVHAWGTYTIAPWWIEGSDGNYVNCYSDGNGIVVLGSRNHWQGRILGTDTPGQFVVKLGDGTSRTIGQNDIDVEASQFTASPYEVITSNTTRNGNRHRAVASMGAVSRYLADGGIAILASTVASGAGTLTVDDTSFLAASGTLYGDDGTNRSASIAYTGKTATTLTGVSGLPAGGLTAGAALWKVADSSGVDHWEIWDYENTGSSGLYVEHPTPNSQTAHTATKTTAIQYVFQEGVNIGSSGGTKISRHISGTATWDPGSIADGAMTSTTVTVTGAAVGDTVAVGFSTAVPAGALLTGAVTASNTVTVTLFNKTGGNLDLASGTLRADVWQH